MDEVVQATLAPAASAGVRRRWPKAAELLAEAEEDILAYMAFPAELWARIYSTNPLERLNKEVKRRTNVVGVFPDRASVVRLAGAVLLEIADDWLVGRRDFSLESMARLNEPEHAGSRTSAVSPGACSLKEDPRLNAIVEEHGNLHHLTRCER